MIDSLTTGTRQFTQEELDRFQGQDSGEFSKGMRSSTLSMRQGLSNAMGAVGGAMGFDEYAKDQYQQADALGMRAQNAAPRVTSFRDIKGAGDAVDWGMGVAGGLLPSAAVGVGAGLLGAVVLGAVVELAIVRRFFRAPRLLLTVATIGVSQLLVVAATLLPRWWGKTIFADQTMPDPFQASIEIGNQTFGGAELLALVVAPVLMAALALFLQGTDIGIAVRASAERGDRAALLGVPVKRLQTLVWVLAAVLSYVGVFLHAGIFGFGAGAALSPQALTFALAALVLGRLDHLPAITASAVALRILEQGVRATYPSNPGRVYVVLAAVVLVSLVVRRATTTRASADAVSSWTAAEEVRPIPRELASLTVVRVLRAVGPLLVLAGPGSGKTRVITHRAAYLARTITQSRHILAITFTNKAAREMEKRVVHLLGGTGKLDGLSIGTFHAICARILRVEAEFTTRTRDYLIFDTSDQQAVVKQALIELNKVKDSYNVSRLAQAGAVAALDDQESMLAHVARVRATRERVIRSRRPPRADLTEPLP